MDVFWIVLGSLVLLVALADTFFAVLNYNERGLVVNRVARLVWVMLRTQTRRVPQRHRAFALRQVTGLIMVTVILTWIGGVLLGYALIYFGAMGLGGIDVQKGAPPGFWAALYMSIGQFSTVGVENISAVHPLIDYLTVIQALSSVVLLSMIVTFLLNVFNGIQMLRSLCADVSLPTTGIGDPLGMLFPFFPEGKDADIDRYLAATWEDMNFYGDVLRQTRTTYYFQSGDPQFSAPFALISVSNIIGALRWGLPVGFSSVSARPGLLRLEESLAAARQWISSVMLRLEPMALPTPVSKVEFTRMLQALRNSDAAAGGVDPSVEQFDRMCRAAARLTSATQSEQTAIDADPAEAYRRYVEWLPFGMITNRFNAAISEDLDYQPDDLRPTPPPFTPDGVARALVSPSAVGSPQSAVIL